MQTTPSDGDDIDNHKEIFSQTPQKEQIKTLQDKPEHR
jgi:hypothetical protein